MNPLSLSNSYSFSLLSHVLLGTPCLCVCAVLQGGLLINHHADQSLNSFCQWQSALVGKNGKRHDHAILLTGFDICSWKNEPCDTLGVTPQHGLRSLGLSTAGAELVSNKRGHFFTFLLVFLKRAGQYYFWIVTSSKNIFDFENISERFCYYFLFVTACLFLNGIPP